MTSWDELFQAAAGAAPDVDEFYEEYGAAPSVSIAGGGDDASEAYLGKRSKGKGKGRGKGRNRKGKGKGMETDPADIEVVSPSKSVESEAENSQAEDQEEEVRIQDGESFAEACFAAALEHDEQERPPRARGRKWYWKRKN